MRIRALMLWLFAILAATGFTWCCTSNPYAIAASGVLTGLVLFGMVLPILFVYHASQQQSVPASSSDEVAA